MAKKIKEAIITKTIVHKSNIGKKRGWSFSVYWDNRSWANFVGALYTTKVKASKALEKYIKTGKVEFYGDAE